MPEPTTRRDLARLAQAAAHFAAALLRCAGRLAGAAARFAWRWGSRDAAVPRGVVAGTVVTCGLLAFTVVVLAERAPDPRDPAVRDLAMQQVRLTIGNAGSVTHTALAAPVVEASELDAGAALSRLPAWTPGACARFADAFVESADRHSVHPALLVAQAIIESGCGCADTVLQGRGNVAGALGIMQIVPRWHPDYDPARAMDHAYTIDYGARYMSELLATKSIEDAVGSYNGGGNHWGKTESQVYRRYVMGMFSERDEPTSAHFEEFMAGAGAAWIGRTDVEGCER